EEFGWSEQLRRQFAPFAAQGLQPARVTVQQRGLFTLVADDGELLGRVAGRLAHDAAPGALPVAGDWVAIAARPAEGAATIHAVLPRRTAFVRRAADTTQGAQVVAANVDIAFLVAALNGDFNLRRLERYLAAARESGAQPVVLLTKADLVDDVESALAAARSVAGDAPALAVSAQTGEGMEALNAWLAPGLTCALLGSSGTGKSTLVNALAGRELMATGAVREDDARGRHTTTYRELVRLPCGALALDTPGMRELGLLDAGAGVASTFEDIEALATRCRFRDCRHGDEPGCAVRAALETGELDPGRWRGFDKLRRETAHFERREDPLAREAERRRWMAIHKAQRARRRSQEDWG
ncbi:MAG TPA: ribosome small subunit-dependent GTPase A, partial [Caulobacteraceae bacterium]|nr:ribosome small subunit-dependent GTPase A [Caulobacteraceae bacterium]